MLLIITPVSGWRRRIQVYSFIDGTEKQWFEAFRAANDMYADIRDKVNIQLVPIRLDQLPEWLENNVDPTWLEHILGRYRVELTKLMRNA